MSRVTFSAGSQSASADYTVTGSQGTPMILGANTESWDAAKAALGPITARRIFHTGGLPSSYSKENLLLPATGEKVLGFISYKSINAANDAAFAKSCPDGTRIIYHHEPENDYGGNGAQYVSEFKQAYTILKDANPKVLVGTGALTYQYASGEKWGANGSYLPPVTHCDFYGADDYVEKISAGAGGLGSNAEFLAWYNMVKDRGKPLAFCEYGRGVNAVGYTTDQWATLRPQVMANDDAWLKAHPGFQAILYWYNTGPKGDWRFYDQGSKDQWRKKSSLVGV